MKDKDLSGCKVYGSVAMWVSVSGNCPKDKVGGKTGLALGGGEGLIQPSRVGTAELRLG